MKKYFVSCQAALDSKLLLQVSRFVVFLSFSFVSLTPDLPLSNDVEKNTFAVLS